MKSLLQNLFVLLAIANATALYSQITPSSAIIDSTRTNDPLISTGADSSVVVEDIETYADRWVPRKASLYAAAIPGLGQIYNRKYWKLPLVYGGFTALALTANFYRKEHNRFRGELFQLLQDNTFAPPSGANEEQLRSAINKARRERDFYFIMTGVFYLIQILDAHIDAHLKEFELNPDLKMAVSPIIGLNPLAGNTMNTGVSLKFTFK